MQKREPSDDINKKVALADRLTELEKDFAKQKGGSSTTWQRWFDVLAKLLLPVLLFWLAFTFKDSVQHALEYRALEVKSAEAIEKLLQTLHEQEIEIGKARAAALTLSAYGEAAIMPLVGALEHGSPNTETAAKQGLFIIGLNHPEAVTQGLGTVLSKRNQQFRWQTHQAAIEILGKIGQAEARKMLLSYRSLLEKPSNEGLLAWQKTVRESDKANYEETLKTLNIALAVFGDE